MKNVTYIMLLCLIMLYPTHSNALLTSTNFTLNEAETVSGVGNSSSPSYTQSNIVIGRSAVFSTYSANSMKSGFYKFLPASAVSRNKSDAAVPINTVSVPVIIVNAVPNPFYGKKIILSGSYSDISGISLITATHSTAVPVIATLNNGIWTATITGLSLGTNAITITAENTIGNHSTITENIITGYSGANGKLTILDALKILRIAVNDTMPTADEQSYYDLAPFVNGSSLPDGSLDVSDALIALKIAVGLI